MTAGLRAPAPLLVLVEPQDIVNIASAVRVAKNFGIEQVRLVAPEVFDPWRIEGIAHNTADVVDRITLHDTLDEALADTVSAVALTARQRAAKRTVLRPRAAATELTDLAEEGPVAIVAGREDKGLTNEELDRCRLLVTIDTNPDHKSLNLAQAVAIMCYESWQARLTHAERPVKSPRRPAGPATADQMEWLFRDWERTLWGIEFFKTRQPEHVMRSVREVFFRAGLDGREATLYRAMALEVVRYMTRVGAPVGEPAPEGTPPPGDEGDPEG